MIHTPLTQDKTIYIKLILEMKVKLVHVLLTIMNKKYQILLDKKKIEIIHTLRWEIQEFVIHLICHNLCQFKGWHFFLVTKNMV